MTSDPDEERFSVGLRFGQVNIEFYINSKSTTGKRWAFFGLLTFLIALLAVNFMAPQIKDMMQWPSTP